MYGERNHDLYYRDLPFQSAGFVELGSKCIILITKNACSEKWKINWRVKVFCIRHTFMWSSLTNRKLNYAIFSGVFLPRDKILHLMRVHIRSKVRPSHMLILKRFLFATFGRRWYRFKELHWTVSKFTS